MNDLAGLLLLGSLIALYIWLVLRHDLYGDYYSGAALGVPPCLPEAGSSSASQVQETMRRICLACGYATASEFLLGAENAFRQFTDAARKGDMMETAALASASARERISSCVGLYSAEIASCAQIVDAGIIGRHAWIKVRFGRASVPLGLWESPKSWGESRQQAMTALQTWTFERNLRSADPNWFLASVEDPIPPRGNKPQRLTE